jgi:hypothetical protein
MRASFFVAELVTFPNNNGNVTPERGEHELHWVPIIEAGDACFHACHAWAINQAAGLDDR